MNWFERWIERLKQAQEDRIAANNTAMAEAIRLREERDAADKKEKEERESKVNAKLEEAIDATTKKLEDANFTVINKHNRETYRGEPWGVVFALDPGNKPYKVFCKGNGYYTMTPLAPVKESEAHP